nr:Hsp20/alpha crystallin family protein [uncultured Merdimonas sp.]
MMMPSIFGENLFDDDWMDFPFDSDFWGKKNPLYGKNAKNMMKTDIREHDEGYELDVDLPGFKKDEINVQLDNGYLTISASKGLDKDQKDEKGRYIRQERYAGAMQRSFYVGDAVSQEDIKAKYEDGILKLSVPKKDAKAVEAKNTIAIEG